MYPYKIGWYFTPLAKPQNLFSISHPLLIRWKLNHMICALSLSLANFFGPYASHINKSTNGEVEIGGTFVPYVHMRGINCAGAHKLLLRFQFARVINISAKLLTWNSPILVQSKCISPSLQVCCSSIGGKNCGVMPLFQSNLSHAYHFDDGTQARVAGCECVTCACVCVCVNDCKTCEILIGSKYKTNTILFA